MDCVHLILSACLPLATKIRALHTELCCVLLSNEVSNKERGSRRRGGWVSGGRTRRARRTRATRTRRKHKRRSRTRMREGASHSLSFLASLNSCSFCQFFLHVFQNYLKKYCRTPSLQIWNLRRGNIFHTNNYWTKNRISSWSRWRVNLSKFSKILDKLTNWSIYFLAQLKLVIDIFGLVILLWTIHLTCPISILG